MKNITIGLLLFISLSLEAQVYHLGKNIGSVDVDYVNVTWVITSTPSSAKGYWIGTWAKDSISEAAFKEKPNLKKMKQLLPEFYDRGQLRDSIGQILPISNEVQLFNYLSKSGFEFIKKDAPIGDVSIGVMTNYLFRRKQK